MAHTHEYDCIVCGAHLESLDELDRHNRQQHTPPDAAKAAHAKEPVGNEHARRYEPPDSET